MVTLLLRILIDLMVNDPVDSIIISASDWFLDTRLKEPQSNGEKLFGKGANAMSLYWTILLANTATMLITISAAIKRPIWSYKLIAAVCICSFIFALHQVTTDQYSQFTMLFTGLSVLAICLRVMMSSKGR